MSAVFINPTQATLDTGVSSDAFFAFTSAHRFGPKLPGLAVYEPADSRGYRHSRYFRTFKEAERTYGWTDVIREGIAD